MLRIHFTDEDLARTRIAAGPDALWETLLSLYRLRRHEGRTVFGEWRQRAVTRVPAGARLLVDLAPPRGYAVDFLTPTTATGSLTSGLEALRGTSRARLRRDVGALAHSHPRRQRPAWVGELAERPQPVLDRVADAVSQYFEGCLGPYWSQIQRHVERDRARRGRTLLEGGWQDVLTRLHPSACWRPPVLELAFPADRDLRLGGRGLLLQPSFFCWGAPTTLRDPSLPPVLVYPVERTQGWATEAAGGRKRALNAVLGGTRYRILNAVTDSSCSTTELARRVRMPLPTVSKQAAVLREAGLVASQRHGNAVLHTATAAGVALLSGGAPDD